MSAFEISYKVRIGKLDAAKELVERFDEVCEKARLVPLSLSPAHALRAGQLNGEHFDPFDRMIAAQAIVEGVPVLTVDRQIGALGAETVWG